jgi:hypothetical protein
MMFRPLQIIRSRERLSIGCRWQCVFFHHSECTAG